MKISEKGLKVESSLENRFPFFFKCETVSVCQGFPRADLTEFSCSCRWKYTYMFGY
jgi:hypothetical protein